MQQWQSRPPMTSMFFLPTNELTVSEVERPLEATKPSKFLLSPSVLNWSQYVRSQALETGLFLFLPWILEAFRPYKSALILLGRSRILAGKKQEWFVHDYNLAFLLAECWSLFKSKITLGAVAKLRGGWGRVCTVRPWRPRPVRGRQKLASARRAFAERKVWVKKVSVAATN